MRTGLNPREQRAARVTVLLAQTVKVAGDDLCAALGSAAGIRVVTAAVAELPQAVHRHRPDVAVLDLSEPQPGGFSAIAVMRRFAPGTGVVVLAPDAGLDSVRAAIQAGVRGYLVKGAAPEDFVLAVRTVAAGGVLLSELIADRLTEMFATPTVDPHTPLSALTSREREVFDLLAAGFSNPVIADELHLAPKTIRNLVSAVFTKLDVSTRAEAIVRAQTLFRTADVTRCG